MISSQDSGLSNEEFSGGTPDDYPDLRGKLDWHNDVITVLCVCDGTVKSFAVIPSGATIQAALEDYAAGYDAGEVGVTITVTWACFQNNEMIEDGRWWFKST